MKPVVFLLFVLAFLAPAQAQNFVQAESRSSVTVLVDMSKSWHNASTDRDENTKVLTSVADAIMSLSEEIDSPIKIRYILIGDLSLGRKTLCDVQYSPKLLNARTLPDGVIQDRMKLKYYLEKTCLHHILALPAEEFTDITGAFSNASNALEAQAGEFRALIALSDFKEERRKGQQGEIGQLFGARTLMLFRILPEDRMNPAGLHSRVEAWRRNLSKAGASVKSHEDSSIEPETIRKLLQK